MAALFHVKHPRSMTGSKIAFNIVTLDGPGGVGKSSTGKALAERLGYYFLSSGRIYRALAWLALRRGWCKENPLPAGLLDDVTIEIANDGVLSVNGEHPGDVLAGGEIAIATSFLSVLPEVRELSNRVQRETVAAIEEAGHFSGVVLEGRDIGTEVFPGAAHKFFLTAKPEIRAMRRFRELKETNPALTLEAVSEDLKSRDARDSGRKLAPLKAAEDAIVMDNSELSLRAAVDAMAAMIRDG